MILNDFDKKAIISKLSEFEILALHPTHTNYYDYCNVFFKHKDYIFSKTVFYRGSHSSIDKSIVISEFINTANRDLHELVSDLDNHLFITKAIDLSEAEDIIDYSKRPFFDLLSDLRDIDFPVPIFDPFNLNEEFCHDALHMLNSGLGPLIVFNKYLDKFNIKQDEIAEYISSYKAV